MGTYIDRLLLLRRKLLLVASILATFVSIVIVTNLIFYYNPTTIRQGEVLISSLPTGATIYLNERELGVTPANLILDDRVYKIKLVLSGFEPVEQGVRVGANTTTTLDIKLIPDIPQNDSILNSLFLKYDSITIALKRALADPNIPRVKEYQILSQQLESLKSAVIPLQEVILENPKKAVSLPLLEKDVEQLKLESSSLRKDIERVWDSSKWYLWIMVSLVIGILTLTAAVWFKKN